MSKRSVKTQGRATRQVYSGEFRASAVKLVLNEEQYVVDVAKGVIGAQGLKRGAVAHRLLRALAEDLFIPHPVGRLFYKLYEDETFDFYSSTLRIYRSINELREISGQEFTAHWLAETLGVSIKTAQSLLKMALEQGQIVKTAKGAKTHYQWVDNVQG